MSSTDRRGSRFGGRLGVGGRLAVVVALAVGLGVAVTAQAFDTPVSPSVTEAGHAVASGCAYESAGEISAPAGALPGQVYVLDSGEISLDFPQDRMAPASSRDCGDAPADQSSGACTIALTAVVVPSRLVVVNEDDTITAICSNTAGSEYGFYCLRVQTTDCEEHPLTQDILAQYNGLVSSVDWSSVGRVYALVQAD